MRIKYLDGPRFRRAIIGGAEWVKHRRHHLNEINVFPVPDGDTGTNMALSLSATAAAVRDAEEKDLSAVSRKAAEGSILGAKGNSGIILAHWFQGLSRHLAGKAHVGAMELAGALDHATQAVYAAMEKPLEGTILTVMRAASEKARGVAGHGVDIAVLLEEVIEACQTALRKTPEMLEALRESNVVDAGAEGFVNFLQGVQRAVSGVPLPEFDEDRLREVVEHPAVPIGELDNRFCTELVVRGKNFHPDRLRRKFGHLGDCLMVVTTGELFKLHVHTNHPEEAMRIAVKLGTIEERKVDDMLAQAAEREHPIQPPLIPLEDQPRTPAVICDSTGDLEDEQRERFGIERVPLQVMFGNQVYRDQLDLSSAEFYAKLSRDPHFPSTSQPPPRAFVEAFDRIRPDREILVLTLSGALSGTLRSAQNAAKLAAQPRVEVFDSQSASGGLGLLALCVARLAATGASMEELLTQLQIWRQDTGCLFTAATLEFLRRGGRIGRARGLLGSILQLRPVLTFADDVVQAAGKARGEERAAVLLRQLMLEQVTPGSRLRVHVVESTASGRLPELERWLDRHYEVIETHRTSITPVVGAHIGPGAWGLFFHRVRDDDPLLCA